MTRENAIEIIGAIDKAYRTFNKEEYEALEMAIKALKQEPCINTISRQAVLNYIYNDLELGDEENGANLERKIALDEIYRHVKTLPPVIPRPKTGHWIDIGSGQMCSKCGEIQYGYDNFRRFCASCGAKMGIKE